MLDRILNMSRQTTKSIVFIGLVGFAIIVSTFLLLPKSPAQPQRPAQPKITWTPTITEVILSPGESTTRDFTLTSDQDLQNAVIEAVPEIAEFLSVQPSTFGSAPANQPQAVRISFSIPASANLGTFDGTIHVRTGSQTLPKTLKIIVNAWRNVQLDSAHVTVILPPDWLFHGTTTQINASTPTLQDLINLHDAEVPPYDFVVRLFSKPAESSIDEFASQFDQGWFEAYATKSATTLDGHDVVVYSDAESVVRHQPLLAAFVDDPEHNQVVVLTMSQLSSGGIEETFQELLSTVQFH